MAFRRPIFLFAIAGIAVFSTLFASMSKFIWFQPSGVAYLEGSPIEESKPVTFYMLLGAREILYLEVTYCNTEEVQLRVEEFSNYLQILTWDGNVIQPPYIGCEKANQDFRTFWKLEIISPNQTGNYGINFKITLRNWVLSQTYKYTLIVSAESSEKASFNG